MIAVPDYMRAVPESIRAFVPAGYRSLDCDGFGPSDTRAIASRLELNVDKRLASTIGSRQRSSRGGKFLQLSAKQPLHLAPEPDGRRVRVICHVVPTDCSTRLD